MGVACQGRVTSPIAVLLDLMKERFGLLLSPVPLILDIRFIGIQPTAVLADCRLSLRKGCRDQILPNTYRLSVCRFPDGEQCL